MDSFSYRYAVLAIVAANITVLSSLYLAQPVLPLFAEEFHVSAAVADLSLSVSTLGLAVALLLLGPLSDRVGRRPVMIVASAALIVPTLGVAASPSFQLLLVFRVFQGACSAGVGSIALAYIIQEFPPDQVGSGLGWGTLSLVAAAVVGRVGGGLIAGLWGWRVMFLVFGGLDLVGVVCMLRLLPRELRFRASAGFGASLAGLREHLRSTALLRVDAIGFLVSFTLLAYFAQLSFYLGRSPFDLGTGELGLVYLVYVVGALAPLAGHISTRVGRGPVAAAGFALLLGGSLLSLQPTLAVVLLATAISSLGLFMTHTADNAYVGDVARVNRGGATALYMFFYYLGGAVGVFVLGVAWDDGGWTAVIGGCVVASALGLILALGLPRPAVLPEVPFLEPETPL